MDFEFQLGAKGAACFGEFGSKVKCAGLNGPLPQCSGSGVGGGFIGIVGSSLSWASRRM